HASRWMKRLRTRSCRRAVVATPMVRHARRGGVCSHGSLGLPGPPEAARPPPSRRCPPAATRRPLLWALQDDATTSSEYKRRDDRMRAVALEGWRDGGREGGVPGRTPV